MAINEKKVASMTTEVLELLCSDEYSELWNEVAVYGAGNRYSSSPTAGADKNIVRIGNCDVYVEEDCMPNFSRFLPAEDEHVFSMTFEGPLCQVLNFNPDYDMPEFMEKFDAIFRKYEVFYEQMESWNLTCYPV